MSYPKTLLRLQPQRGYAVDTPDQELPLDYWSICANMQFRDGFATRIGGFRTAYLTELDTLAPDSMYHAVHTDLAGQNWWLLAEANGDVHAIQEGTVSKIDNGLFSPVTDPQQYSSALINGIPILNNGLNEPVYWPGSGLMETLPDWPATESCAFIAVLKFHVFAFNISAVGGQFETLVKWSSATEPGTVPQSWTPSAENDAGSVILADSPGPILCAYPLGDTLYIYKRTATYQARFVGGNSVFSFRKVQSNSGALGPRAVADIGGAHLVITDGDIYINDGTTRESIAENIVRDFLFDQIDPEKFQQIQAIYNRSKDEVFVGFPSVGSAFMDRALIYDLSRGAWGVRELDQVTHIALGLVSDTTPSNTWENRTEVWADAQGVWSAGLTGGPVDSLMTLEQQDFVQQDSGTGVAVNAVIGRSGLTFGEPERIKFVRRVHLRTSENFAQLFVRVGASFTPTGAISWSPEVEITQGQQIVNTFAQGRYIAVEVRGEDSNIWKCTGIDLEAELRGYH